MSAPIAIAVVGAGKIACDQHIPALRRNGRFSLVGAVDPHATHADLKVFPTLRELIARQPGLQAVSICTPPHGRLELVREAAAMKLDVLLEKPPASTLCEAEALTSLFEGSDQVLFVTWHSQEAAGVEAAEAWLAARKVLRATVSWHEDVRVWHPRQEWIWRPGIGVFDPGINALSILTRLLPGKLLIEEAELAFPSNREAPIAASLRLSSEGQVPIDVSFDFNEAGPQIWEVAIETDGGTLRLVDGGCRLQIDGVERSLSQEGEYSRLYGRFADMVESRDSRIDLQPFKLVADAFMTARRRTVDPFEWSALTRAPDGASPNIAAT